MRYTRKCGRGSIFAIRRPFWIFLEVSISLLCVMLRLVLWGRIPGEEIVLNELLLRRLACPLRTCQLFRRCFGVFRRQLPFPQSIWVSRRRLRVRFRLFTYGDVEVSAALLCVTFFNLVAFGALVFQVSPFTPTRVRAFFGVGPPPPPIRIGVGRSPSLGLGFDCRR